MLNNLNRAILKSKMAQARAYHSVNISGAKATSNQKSVMVYDSPEFESFSQASNSSAGNVASWDSMVMASPHKSKFFSLLPFQMESVSQTLNTILIILNFRNFQTKTLC